MRDDDESYSHEYFSSQAAEIGLYPGQPADERERLIADYERRNEPTPAEEWDRQPPPKAEDEDAPEGMAVFDDLPPVALTDEEALGIARRAMQYKTAAEVIMANAEMMAAEELRKLDTLFAEEGERIRQWITAEDPERKSRRTFFGILGTRKSGGTLTIVDEVLALASAKDLAPSAVREVVDKTKLPKNFTAPGFDLTPEVSNLYVQPLPKKKNGGED